MKWSERELFHAWEGADYYDVSIINIFKEKKSRLTSMSV